MKYLVLAACLSLMIGVPTISGAEFTRTGPPIPAGDFYHGGGGGP